MPHCHKKLKAYKTEERHIISIDLGSFTAVHRLMRGRKCSRIFRSDDLDNKIKPYCTYANDIMVDAAMKRFLDGRSCSEISSGMGISEGQARNLSKMALDIMQTIHEEGLPMLRSAIGSYILQIDGTTDSEFAMIVVVRDAESGFTLHAERCFSESEDNIVMVLEKIRERFGIPSGSISDMRSGILNAASKVFPGMPVRICLMHFLRDLGKDIMNDLHTDLGIAINKAGIKRKLKKILRAMPGYDSRYILERESGSSGYGFPFSLRHFNFYNACVNAGRELAEIKAVATGRESRSILEECMELVSRVTENIEISRMANKLGKMNALFQALRKAFHVPDRGDLSSSMDDNNRGKDNINRDSMSHETSSIFIDQLKSAVTQNNNPVEIDTTK